MKEKSWFQQLSAAEKRAMAKKLKTSVDWLYQISGGFGTPSAKLAKAIHDYSKGAWPKHSLRPDIFGSA